MTQNEYKIIALEKKIKNQRNWGIVTSSIEAISSMAMLGIAIQLGLNKNIAGAVLDSIASACFATASIIDIVTTKKDINRKREIIQSLKK
ncbi:MAG: hypothetical protein IJK67_06105 [Bacilli bacterium]|nr:hypothetical protein [Bacilli bacterium]